MVLQFAPRSAGLLGPIHPWHLACIHHAKDFLQFSRVPRGITDEKRGKSVDKTPAIRHNPASSDAYVRVRGNHEIKTTTVNSKKRAP